MMCGQNRGGAEIIEELDTNSYVIHKTHAVPPFPPLIYGTCPPTMVAPTLVAPTGHMMPELCPNTSGKQHPLIHRNSCFMPQINHENVLTRLSK